LATNNANIKTLDSIKVLKHYYYKPKN